MSELALTKYQDGESMYNNILVPLDRTEEAESILPYVEQLAGNNHTNIIFLHVIQQDRIALGTDIPYPRQFHEEFKRQVKASAAYLSGLEGKFRNKGIQTKKIILHGPVVETIQSVAKNEGVDLIALASHGWNGLPIVHYGSVTAGLLRKIDLPLLLIKSNSEN